MFAGMFGTFLALSIIAILTFGVLMFMVFKASKDINTEVKEKTILHIKFDDPITDRTMAKPNIMAFSVDTKNGLKKIINAIKKAKTDKKIKGIYLDLTTVDAGLATIEELRNTFADFKTSGKFIVTHADYFTHKSYYLASVADKLYLTPEGEIQFTGLSAQIMLYKSLLEKIGIEPEIIRHGKFKSAVEPFMLNEISNANREQTKTYMSSIWETMLLGISESRGIETDKLNMYADSLRINSAKKCVEYNFADSLLYADQVIEELKKLVGIENKDKLNLIELKNYAGETDDIDFELEITGNKIAVIYATGQIMPGEGDDEKIGSETLSKAIRKARKDTTIKAIVLRINSPGGSALASEVIWRETVLAQKVKPLIVSMGNVAASGGYYIACSADTIVAQPNTITGSIGVFGLMFNGKKLLNDIGVNISTVNTNKYADIMSPLRKMTSYERNIIQTGVEDIYDTFIGHVAEGRGMTKAEIDSIGQGRVWSGKNAKEIGLVDVFGGLETAITIASEKAGLTDYKIIDYPEKDEFDKLFEDFASNIKASVMEEELGVGYKYYKRFKSVKNIKGIQAGMPYFIDIE